jgi:hypothetical protein
MANYLSNAIRIQAFEMARSGEFIDCQSIETALEKSGIANARIALRDRPIRSRLDKLCAQNWRSQNANPLRAAG